MVSTRRGTSIAPFVKKPRKPVRKWAPLSNEGRKLVLTSAPLMRSGQAGKKSIRPWSVPTVMPTNLAPLNLPPPPPRTSSYRVKLDDDVIAYFPKRPLGVPHRLLGGRMAAFGTRQHPKGGLMAERYKIMKALKRKIYKLIMTDKVPMTQVRAIQKTMGTGVFRRDFVRNVYNNDIAGDMERVRNLMRTAGSRTVRKVDRHKRAGDKAIRMAEFLSNMRRDSPNINRMIREGNIGQVELAQKFKKHGLTGFTDKAMQKIAKDVIAAQRNQ